MKSTGVLSACGHTHADRLEDDRNGGNEHPRAALARQAAHDLQLVAGVDVDAREPSVWSTVVKLSMGGQRDLAEQHQLRDLVVRLTNLARTIVAA